MAAELDAGAAACASMPARVDTFCDLTRSEREGREATPVDSASKVARAGHYRSGQPHVRNRTAENGAPAAQDVARDRDFHELDAATRLNDPLQRRFRALGIAADALLHRLIEERLGV